MKKNRKDGMPCLPRDVSWMYFNRRILQEARREDVPLREFDIRKALKKLWE